MGRCKTHEVVQLFPDLFHCAGISGGQQVEELLGPLFTTGGAERAGLGFAVMESFMDSVKVRSAPGKGTRVTLSKRLGTR